MNQDSKTYSAHNRVVAATSRIGLSWIYRIKPTKPEQIALHWISVFSAFQCFTLPATGSEFVYSSWVPRKHLSNRGDPQVNHQHPLTRPQYKFELILKDQVGRRNFSGGIKHCTRCWIDTYEDIYSLIYLIYQITSTSYLGHLKASWEDHTR